MKRFIQQIFFYKYHLYFLGIAWFAVQTISYLKFGVVTEFEATKYIDQAQHLTNTGSYTSNNFILYSIPILIIALSIKLKIGFGIVVALQMILNGISIWLFYKLVCRFTQRSHIAFIATAFFLSMFFYHLYNVHLFTESIFFSLSIFYAYFLFTIKKINLSSITLLVISLIILTLARPTGLLFFPPSLAYLIFRFARKGAVPVFIATAVGGALAFYFVLNAALNSGGELDFLLPYIEEHVICGVPQVQKPHTIQMPLNKNSVEGLWYLITHNANLFMRLGWERFVAFWGVKRPFYSAAHNLFICVYFYLVYLAILIGLKRMVKSLLPQMVFMLSYIFLIMLTVVLSCDEWHNRFIFSILPFLLLLSIGFFSRKESLPN